MIIFIMKIIKIIVEDVILGNNAPFYLRFFSALPRALREIFLFEI